MFLAFVAFTLCFECDVWDRWVLSAYLYVIDNLASERHQNDKKVTFNSHDTKFDGMYCVHLHESHYIHTSLRFGFKR